MRTESDVHGPHGSNAPLCGNCGLPLHPEMQVCPFCEHHIDAAPTTALARRTTSAVPPTPRYVAGIPERTLLIIGACVFASLAVISLALSALV